MKDSTDRPTRRTSPGWEPPLWLLIAGTILVAVFGLLAAHRIISNARAQAGVHCPAPDHPVWAPGLGQWLCGDSITVTAR